MQGESRTTPRHPPGWRAERPRTSRRAESRCPARGGARRGGRAARGHRDEHPGAESLSRRLLRRARSEEGHRGRRGKGGGRAPPRVFRAQAAGAARTFPFFGIGAGGAGHGSCDPRSHRPLPRRGTRQVQPGALGKVRYKFPCWVGVARSAGTVLGRKGSPGASAAASALPWGVRCGVTSAGRGLQGGD